LEDAEQLKTIFVANAVGGLLTCGLGTYISLNQGEGGALDVHAQVEPAVKAIMTQNPLAPENEVRQYLNDRADTFESGMMMAAFAFAAISLAATEFSYRLYKKAASRLNGPQP